MTILLLDSKTVDTKSKDWNSFSKRLTETVIKKCGWKISQIEDIDCESDPYRRINVKVESRLIVIRTFNIYDSKSKKSVCCDYSVYEIIETDSN
jgi:hypothetical protein